MKEVFIVQINDVMEGVDQENKLLVFEDNEKALVEFHKQVRDYRTITNESLDKYEIEETENDFVAWEEGHFANNHISVSIKKYVVQ